MTAATRKASVGFPKAIKAGAIVTLASRVLSDSKEEKMVDDPVNTVTKYSSNSEHDLSLTRRARGPSLRV